MLIEKPARGDFLPIVDGGYALQYSPLWNIREGKGMVLFCQMDVTGRTEAEPAADIVVRNLLSYVAAWKPSPRRRALYVGEPAGKKHFQSSGLSPTDFSPDALVADSMLIVGPGGGQALMSQAKALRKWLEGGGHLLAIGLDANEARRFLPFKVTTKKAEHIATYFESAGIASLLAGVGPADVHNRDPRLVPLVTGGAAVIGNGVLAKAEHANVVFCQFGAVAIPAHQANEREADVPPRGIDCKSTRSQHGSDCIDAGPESIQRRGEAVRAALARGPLPRRARGMGRPVSILPLVSASVARLPVWHDAPRRESTTRSVVPQ